MKLSESQQHVIDRMKTGWQLGETMTFEGGFWMQEGGCGHGGEHEKVGAGTVQALLKRRLIEMDQSKFPIRTWKLTKRGMKVGS